MKKTYTKPIAEEYSLQVASVLAMSEVQDGNLTYNYEEFEFFS